MHPDAPGDAPAPENVLESAILALIRADWCASQTDIEVMEAFKERYRPEAIQQALDALAARGLIKKVGVDSWTLTTGHVGRGSLSRDRILVDWLWGRAIPACSPTSLSPPCG
jgi:hypothetical protein